MKSEKSIQSILPERIRYYRSKKKLTQGQLSELLNVTEHYIVEIENSLKFPSIELIKSISKVLEVPIYNLMQAPDSCDLEDYDIIKNILLSKDDEELHAMLNVLLTVNRYSTS